ncbi:MAG: ion transporter [Thermoleophilaceae bacterium]
MRVRTRRAGTTGAPMAVWDHAEPVERSAQTRLLARIVASRPFDVVVFVAILANAVVLGAQTYEGLVREYGRLLDTLNGVFLGVFVVELVLRMGSYGRRPQNFFRSGWNIFDFVVVASGFVPGVRENTTLLRLLRLLRVVRVVRLLPDLRVLLVAVARSLPPLASMSVLTVLILFVFGMVGWLLFGEAEPAAWGDIGRAMLTLFVMLSLENLPANLERGMEIHPWSWVYFVSFALIASFIVLNVLIGVVLNSMEEAREIEMRRALREEVGREKDDAETGETLAARVGALRTALDDLERDLLAGRGGESGR